MQLADVTNFLGITDTKSKEPIPPENPVFDLEKLGEKKVLYTWEAPLRPTVTAFNTKITKNLFIIGGVLGLFLLLIGEFFIILVIASVIFTGYILANTPTETASYELSTHGVKFIDQFYYWNELGNFFFTQNGGHTILNIDVKEKLPARLFLTVLDGEKEKVRDICESYLPYLKEAPESFMDKGYKKLVSKLDL
ncbi:hypothetical protein KBG31_02390 [Patescibacteria group bacterium]|nr:hypothetical protein [Patescibacteria group bacterium]HOM77659.1 hypothetical protein [bacterium]